MLPATYLDWPHWPAETGVLSVPASRLRSELEALGMVSVHASVDTEAVHFAPDDKQIIQVRLSLHRPEAFRLLKLSCSSCPSLMLLPTLVRLSCWMHGMAGLICAC